MVRRKKRGIEDIADLHPDPVQAESILYERLLKMPEPQRSYAAFSYLFGNRVSEALGIRTREIVASYTYYKKRKNKEPLKIVIPKYKVTKDPLIAWEVPPLERWRLQELDGVLWVRGIHTLKRERGRRRDEFLLISGSGEERFVNILRHYIRDFEQKEGYDQYQPLWNFSRQSAYRYFMKYLELPPHKLRGLRSTKEAVYYDLGASDLQKKRDWADPKMPMHYANKTKKDILDKMKRNVGAKDA